MALAAAATAAGHYEIMTWDSQTGVTWHSVTSSWRHHTPHPRRYVQFSI